MDGIEARTNKLLNLKYGNQVTEADLDELDRDPTVQPTRCIEFMHMHSVRIYRNSGKEYHQQFHVEAFEAVAKAQELRAKGLLGKEPWKVGYVMLIPVNREGVTIRLLVPMKTDDGIHFVVRNFFVPFGSVLYYRADLFVSECYGDAGNTRVKALFLPHTTRNYRNGEPTWLDDDRVKALNLQIHQSELGPHCPAEAYWIDSHARNVMYRIAAKSASSYDKGMRNLMMGQLRYGFYNKFYTKKSNNHNSSYLKNCINRKTREPKFKKLRQKQPHLFQGFVPEVETKLQQAMESQFYSLKNPGRTAEMRDKEVKKKNVEDGDGEQNLTTDTKGGVFGPPEEHGKGPQDDEPRYMDT
jgi:hypothetical protein